MPTTERRASPIAFLRGNTYARNRDQYCRAILFFLRIHDIGSHRELGAAYDVFSGVEQEPVLEEQDAPGLGNNVCAANHVEAMERGSTSFERLLAFLACSVVEIQMERKIGTLFLIGCFVGAVAVSFCRQYSSTFGRALRLYSPLKYSPPTYFRNRILSFRRVIFHTSCRFKGPLPVTFGQFRNRWISGTAPSTLAQTFATISGLSYMMRPHFRVSSYRAWKPPPMFTMALSHLPSAVASAAATSISHSFSVNTPSRTTAHSPSYSGSLSLLKSTTDLVRFGAGPSRKSAGSSNFCAAAIVAVYPVLNAIGQMAEK